MAKKQSPKIVTKKHLARLDRERRQTRIITGIAIGIIVIVVLGIAYGLPNDTLFLNWRPAVTVNGETRSLHEFQVRVRVAREQLIGQYMQYMQLAQMFGLDPTSDPQMSQSLNQITSSLDTPTTVGGQVMQDMVDDLLIRQYAKANGITVAADEVEKAAQAALNYYPSGTQTPTLTPTALVYATLDATQNGIDYPDFHANRCAYRDPGSNRDSLPDRDTQPDRYENPHSQCHSDGHAVHTAGLPEPIPDRLKKLFLIRSYRFRVPLYFL